MEQSLLLWSFLQAYQKTPYSHVYVNLIKETLLHLTEPSLEEFLQRLHDLNPTITWWENYKKLTLEILSEERKSFRPDFKLIFFGSSEFPKALQNMQDPPLALSVQGDLNLIKNQLCLSVVGSREPHEMTSRWMQTELYQTLKDVRPVIISGGARGIDQKAHMMAMILDIPTVVMLPSGLANKYPAMWEDKKWNDKKIIFVSELMFSARISKKFFAERNRLIAAWGAGTLIAEARQRSGTLITGHHALAGSKPVWCVPGHPSMPSFAGCLQLLMCNAKIVRNATDLSSFIRDEQRRFSGSALGLGEQTKFNL